MRALTSNDIFFMNIPNGFYYRDSDHSYFFDGKRMTGVTTILGVLAKPALIGWAARMTGEYISEECDWVKEDVADGNNGYFKVFNSDIDKATKAYAAIRDTRAEEGTDVHALAEEYIKTCIEHGGDAHSAGGGDSPAIQAFAGWAQENDIKFLASELKLYSKSMFLAGTADFLFEKDGKRYVGDIKNKKAIWSREPFFQCAGYSIMAEEMGEKPFDGYCVVRLWEKDIEVLWSFDVKGDREAFKSCVTLYRSLANFKKPVWKQK